MAQVLSIISETLAMKNISPSALPMLAWRSLSTTLNNPEKSHVLNRPSVLKRVSAGTVFSMMKPNQWVVKKEWNSAITIADSISETIFSASVQMPLIRITRIGTKLIFIQTEVCLFHSGRCRRFLWHTKSRFVQGLNLSEEQVLLLERRNHP